MSGKTIENIRKNLTMVKPKTGDYNWDYLDGLNEMPSHFQEKIKLAIVEGKIADEDWNGVSNSARSHISYTC